MVRFETNVIEAETPRAIIFGIMSFLEDWRDKVDTRWTHNVMTTMLFRKSSSPSQWASTEVTHSFAKRTREAVT